jgi:hypothetical protein
MLQDPVICVIHHHQFKTLAPAQVQIEYWANRWIVCLLSLGASSSDHIPNNQAMSADGFVSVVRHPPSANAAVSQKAVPQTSMQVDSIVSISYEELLDPSSDISSKIEQVGRVGLEFLWTIFRSCHRAFFPGHGAKLPSCFNPSFSLQPLHQAYGPHGLGVLTVSGVPGFVERRASLLPLAHNFAVSQACLHNSAMAAHSSCCGNIEQQNWPQDWASRQRCPLNVAKRGYAYSAPHVFWTQQCMCGMHAHKVRCQVCACDASVCASWQLCLDLMLAPSHPNILGSMQAPRY